RRDEGISPDLSRTAAVAARDQAPSLWHRVRDALEDVTGYEESFAVGFSLERLLPCLAATWKRHLQGGKDLAESEAARSQGRCGRNTVSNDSKHQNHGPADELSFPDRRKGPSRRPLQTNQRRVLHRGESPTRRLSRQPVRH